MFFYRHVISVFAYNEKRPQHINHAKAVTIRKASPFASCEM